MNQLHSCLISELSKLKESSKEAVENTDSFNQFKQYMHIKRNVEDELKKLVEETMASSTNHLILVCGSVGDGKSHLLSYLKSQNPEIEKHFYIHNDATESNAPNKTSMDTLSEVLEDYTDEALGKKKPEKNILLAINLGTLNNFLNSKYANKFSFLNKYVKIKNILEPKIEDTLFDSSSYFQYVNLSDYQLFSLTSDGPSSQYMEEAMSKLTNQVDENPFYQSYNQGCKKDCPASSDCPVKYNYELLMEDQVKETIIRYIAELILKYKTIISSRAFFDFLFNIIVGSDIDQAAQREKFEKYLINLDTGEYLSALLPNLFFNFGNFSNTFKSISLIDPIIKRSETLDTLRIKFFNTNNISNLFDDYLNKDKSLDQSFKTALNKIKKDEKGIALNTLLRLYAFIPKANTLSLNINDPIYDKFYTNLYHWNKGNKKELKDLYTEVIDSIYNWNGNSPSNNRMININLGKNQLKYIISQTIDIKQHVKDLAEIDVKTLDKFLPYLILKFIIPGKDDFVCSIKIDFPLYQLLIRISQGYRPNKQDKNNYVNFVDFIDNILEFSNQKEILTITEKSGEKSKSFIISDDEDFGYEFKEKK
ncbi:DNA phosphorothioation-dependent restriction protein DptF [Priestia megaterium]|uniref:DNA phosphorothioation-dependent restriction protein DptF n=1 Tax=Priestia megaterium TaxID=1404 RepID=UPI003D2162BE